eukprot:gene5401-10802_t
MSSSIKAFFPVVYIYPNLPLLHCTLLSRYKRFLADVSIQEKDNSCYTKTIYCPNTGPMLTLIPPDNMSPSCYISGSTQTNRKYEYTLEMICQGNTWVGIHSALANKIVENALNKGLIEECRGFATLQREIKLGDSRIDFKLSWTSTPDVLQSCSNIGNIGISQQKSLKRKRAASKSSSASDSLELSNESKISSMLIEVKSVTLAIKNENTYHNSAQFPDTISERARKHVVALTSHVRSGGKAALLFIIQRDDCHSFSPCDIDKEYVKLIHEASLAGVQILSYAVQLCPESGEIVMR